MVQCNVPSGARVRLSRRAPGVTRTAKVAPGVARLDQRPLGTLGSSVDASVVAAPGRAGKGA